jgi:hypothetical protein
MNRARSWLVTGTLGLFEDSRDKRPGVDQKAATERSHQTGYFPENRRRSKSASCSLLLLLLDRIESKIKSKAENSRSGIAPADDFGDQGRW